MGEKNKKQDDTKWSAQLYLYNYIFIQLHLLSYGRVTSGSEPYSHHKAIAVLLIAACQSIILFLGVLKGAYYMYVTP